MVVSGQFLIDSEASLSGVLARLSQQDKAMSKDMQISKDKPTTAEKTPKGRGKVVDVDVKSNHITLDHEPIAALGWPSMTMGFKVKDGKQLSKLKAGDEVDFDLKAEASEKPDMPAQYTIEHIEKQVQAIKKGLNHDCSTHPLVRQQSTAGVTSHIDGGGLGRVCHATNTARCDS